MKKIFYIIACAAACAAMFFTGCKKSVNYLSYVSETRSEIYVYEDDALSFKIYCSVRETPYASDGIKGQLTPIIEAFYAPSSTPSKVIISFAGFSGEMNYLATSKSFYLSFTGNALSCESVDVNINSDGKERSFKAASVLYDGVINAETALKCVTEYDGELFKSLTEGSYFNGEIYVRLLFDEGCYFYVGVCDKSGNTSAYLVDGESGRIIAERKQNS